MNLSLFQGQPRDYNSKRMFTRSMLRKQVFNCNLTSDLSPSKDGGGSRGEVKLTRSIEHSHLLGERL